MITKTVLIDIIVSDDLPEILAIFKEYDIKVIYVSEERITQWSYGWLWWRKTYRERWVTITVVCNEDIDHYEPLREAVSRGLSIV